MGPDALFLSLSYLCASPLLFVGFFGVEAEAREAAGPFFRTASARGSGRPVEDSSELFIDVTWPFAVGVAWLGLLGLLEAGWRTGGWMELAGPKGSLVGLGGPRGDLTE